MYYKVIHNDTVIDILSDIKYAKTMKKSKKTYVTDRLHANCILASNNVDRYHLSGVPYPEGSGLKTVSLVKMTAEEIAELETSSNPISNGLSIAKKSKIKELREACKSAITSGVNVLLTDNKYHHFAMTIEDQLNLLEIRQMMTEGSSVLLYHETNGEYKEFSHEDMTRILSAAFNHKQEQLLKFNRLKKYVNGLTSFDDVSAVNFSYMI